MNRHTLALARPTIVKAWRSSSSPGSWITSTLGAAAMFGILGLVKLPESLAFLTGDQASKLTEWLATGGAFFGVRLAFFASSLLSAAYGGAKRPVVLATILGGSVAGWLGIDGAAVPLMVVLGLLTTLTALMALLREHDQRLANLAVAPQAVIPDIDRIREDAALGALVHRMLKTERMLRDLESSREHQFENHKELASFDSAGVKRMKHRGLGANYPTPRFQMYTNQVLGQLEAIGVGNAQVKADLESEALRIKGDARFCTILPNDDAWESEEDKRIWYTIDAQQAVLNRAMDAAIQQVRSTNDQLRPWT